MSLNPDPNKQAAEVIYSHKVEHHLRPPIYFNNVPVVTQPFTKHLGMIPDSKLNFNQHLSEKICKANKGIGLLKRLRHKLCRKHLITIYKSHIRPHLYYGEIIYDQSDIDSFINKVESVQYNAALAIIGSIKGTSKERIYRELGFENLVDRRWFRRICTFCKIVKGISPTYLQNYLPVIQHSRNPTRQNLFSVIPSERHFFGNIFFAYSVNQWNNFDPVIRSIVKISMFKNIY